MTSAGRLAARLRAYVNGQDRHVPGDADALARALNEGQAPFDYVYAPDVLDACAPRRGRGRPSPAVEGRADVKAFALHVLACTRKYDDLPCWECTRSEVRARHYLIKPTSWPIGRDR